MFGLFLLIIAVATLAFKSRRALTLENLALGQQVALLERSVKHPRVTISDRIFWCAFVHFVQGGAIIFTHYTPTQWSAGTKRGSASIGGGRVGVSGDRELTPSFANLFVPCNRRTEPGEPRVSTVSYSNSAMGCPKPRFLSI
jgi:hypothetical protein